MILEISAIIVGFGLCCCGTVGIINCLIDKRVEELSGKVEMIYKKVYQVEDNRESNSNKYVNITNTKGDI